VSTSSSDEPEWACPKKTYLEFLESLDPLFHASNELSDQSVSTSSSDLHSPSEHPSTIYILQLRRPWQTMTMSSVVPSPAEYRVSRRNATSLSRVTSYLPNDNARSETVCYGDSSATAGR
jgi:hypothetical protein